MKTIETQTIFDIINANRDKITIESYNNYRFYFQGVLNDLQFSFSGTFDEGRAYIDSDYEVIDWAGDEDEIYELTERQLGEIAEYMEGEINEYIIENSYRDDYDRNGVSRRDFI